MIAASRLVRQQSRAASDRRIALPWLLGLGALAVVTIALAWWISEPRLAFAEVEAANSGRS